MLGLGYIRCSYKVILPHSAPDWTYSNEIGALRRFLSRFWHLICTSLLASLLASLVVMSQNTIVRSTFIELPTALDIIPLAYSRMPFLDLRQRRKKRT